MNRKLIFVSLLLLSAAGAGAQGAKGGLTPQMLTQIRQAGAPTAADRAIANAIQANSIDDLAKGPASRQAIDNEFSVETPQQSIHNQRSSGRCWMFSSLNVLRSKFAQAHQDTLAVEYSQAYLFFWDQLEKANLMLQGVIDTGSRPYEDQRVQFFFRSPIGDGGTFCGVADLAPKYGLVPMSVMPETFSAESTSRMSKVLSSVLRQYGLELRAMVADKKGARQIEARKTEMLATVYRVLALTLGEPVGKFSYAFRDKKGHVRTSAREYTPQEFYQETVGGPLDGTFIMVMNDPRRPYHQVYEVEYDRHTQDGHNWRYLNLPMDEISQLAITSLRAGTKMYSSYDVGKQSDRKRGIADLGMYDYGTLFGITLSMDKAQRIATFDSGSTHAMTLTAVDLDADGRPLKWKVENSWGATSGVSGCMIMSHRWMEEYMFRLVVDKKYVPAETLRLFGQKSTIIPPEDPLFGEDE